MMGNALASLHEKDAALVRARFLSGAKMVDIRKETGVGSKVLREIRDEIFIPLLTDPAAVKELANGPMLNASAMVKLPYARSTMTRLRQKANADRLTDDDRAEIVALYRQERGPTIASIAAKFDIHGNTVRSICKAAAQ